MSTALDAVQSAYLRIMRSSLFSRKGESLDINAAFRALVESIKAVQAAEGEKLWYLGEGEYCALADLIPAAYWAFHACHSGQSSPEYETACVLGTVFSPGMASEPEEGEPEYEAYDAICAAILR